MSLPVWTAGNINSKEGVHNMSNTSHKPAYLRLAQIVGDQASGIDPIIPVSRSNWHKGVKLGRYPQPIQLSERVVVWKSDDIYNLIENNRGI